MSNTQLTATKRSRKAATSHVKLLGVLVAGTFCPTLCFAQAEMTPVLAGQIAEIIPGTTGLTPEASSAAQVSLGSYQPLGIRMASFYIYPSIEFDVSSNNNIFSTETAKTRDRLTTLLPSLVAKSDWNNHALGVTALGKFTRYADQTSENFDDGSLAVNGRLDVLANSYIRGGLGHQWAHEERTSADTIATQATPTTYQTSSTRLGFVRDRGRIALRIDSGVDMYRYDDGVTRAGVPITQRDRDRTEYKLLPRLTYRVSEGYYAFVQVPLNKRDYQQAAASNGLKRSSNGYEIDAGGTFALTGKIKGEIYAGYLAQKYSEFATDTTSGLSVGGNLLWAATPLTSISASASRSIAETTLAAASGSLQTSLAVTIDHQLLNNVVLSAIQNYSIQSYQGLARRDKIYSAVGAVRYVANRMLTASLSATYRHRGTTTIGSGFSQLAISANIRVQY